MPLFGAAKSTQYPPSPLDMIVELTIHEVRIIVSHINDDWNEKWTLTTYIESDDSSQAHDQTQAAVEQLHRPHPSFQQLVQPS